MPTYLIEIDNERASGINLAAYSEERFQSRMRGFLASAGYEVQASGNRYTLNNELLGSDILDMQEVFNLPIRTSLV